MDQKKSEQDILKSQGSKLQVPIIPSGNADPFLLGHQDFSFQPLELQSETMIFRGSPPPESVSTRSIGGAL